MRIHSRLVATGRQFLVAPEQFAGARAVPKSPTSSPCAWPGRARARLSRSLGYRRSYCWALGPEHRAAPAAALDVAPQRGANAVRVRVDVLVPAGALGVERGDLGRDGGRGGWCEQQERGDRAEHRSEVRFAAVGQRRLVWAHPPVLSRPILIHPPSPKRVMLYFRYT